MRSHLVSAILAFLFANVLLYWSEYPTLLALKSLQRRLAGLGLLPGWHLYVDENGVPVNDYGTVNGRTVGKQRYPITIAQQALAYAEAYERHGKRQDWQRFQNCLAWLKDHAMYVDSAAVLPVEFDWPVYNLTAPWQSGLAQGQEIKAFLKAFELTGDSTHLRFAGQLLRAFFLPVESGGVTVVLDSSAWWYEEYADVGAMPSRVLNGMLQALEAIHRYRQKTGSPAAELLFNRGVEAVRRTVHRYDRNGASTYDLLGQPAGWFYHRVHIRYLDFLFQITGDPVFKIWHDRWSAYLRLPFVVRVYREPGKLMLATLLLHWLVLFALVESVFGYLHKRRRFPVTAGD